MGFIYCKIIIKNFYICLGGEEGIKGVIMQFGFDINFYGIEIFKICNNEKDYILKIGSVLEMLFVWLFVIVLLVVIVVFFGGFLLIVFVRFLDWL